MSQTTTPKTILITGATDGIGKALAENYSTNGWQTHPVRLILVGRRPLIDATTIDPTLFTPDSYCQADLAKLESAETIVTWLHANNIDHIDLLIHNAGVGYVGSVHDQPADSICQLINVNLRTPIALTHHLLPHLKNAASENSSKIVFISSVAATLPTPEYAVYTATKAALDGFVRNLQIELAASPDTQNLRAQLISPGATRTNMHTKSGADLDTKKFPTAQKVATQIAAAIDTNRRSSTIGTLNRIVQFAGKHAAPIIDPLIRNRTAKTPKQPIPPQPQPSPQPLPPPLEKSNDPPRICAITGAADGIGKALALRFAKSGYAIKGIDVDQTRSATTEQDLRDAGADATFLVANLLDPADLERTQINLAAGPPITTFVHNAGINAVGHFAQLDLASQLRVLDLNFTAPLLLTADLLSANKLQLGGSLIFLSSLSHYVSYPGAAVYAATKDGIASYARSLSAALAPQKINVLTVFPGPTRTAHARRYSPDNSRENNRMTPDELAQRIVTANTARRRILIPGAVNRIFATLGRIAPHAMEFAMRKALLDKLA